MRETHQIEEETNETQKCWIFSVMFTSRSTFLIILADHNFSLYYDSLLGWLYQKSAIFSGKKIFDQINEQWIAKTDAKRTIAHTEKDSQWHSNYQLDKIKRVFMILKEYEKEAALVYTLKGPAYRKP